MVCASDGDDPKDSNNTPFKAMIFAIRSFSKRGLRTNNNINYSKKLEEASVNAYGIISPNANRDAKNMDLHENYDDSSRADKLIEENQVAHRNNINQAQDDQLDGDLISIHENIGRQLALLLSQFSEDDRNLIDAHIKKNTTLQSLEIDLSVQAYIDKYARPVANSYGNNNDRLTGYQADPRLAHEVKSPGGLVWQAIVASVACIAAIGSAAGTDSGLLKLGAVTLCYSQFDELLDSISRHTQWELDKAKEYRESLIDTKMGGCYGPDTPLLEDLKKAKEWIEDLNELFGIKEVDKEDLISRHLPDKGVIGKEGNPKPWQDDGTINWGELGKQNINPDQSTKAHNGDEYVTDPPKDSEDGGGGVEPSEPPMGNGLRNISSDMGSSKSEMEGNTGLFKDFHHKAWVVNADGEIDDITKHGNQVGDNSYRGWDMIAAEVIGGTNTVIWMHDNGKLSSWKLDSDWDYVGSKVYQAGSDGFSHIENQFATDFNKDGFIGSAPDSFM